MAGLSPKELRTRIERFPRLDLIHAPTPLAELKNLSEVLGGPRLFIKRDDLTGLAFGGNKSRKLQYIIRDAQDRHCDAVITWGGLQSNWCLQTAAASRKFGMVPILMLFKSPGQPSERNGNLLLDVILDAVIHIRELDHGKVVLPEEAESLLRELEAEARDWGYDPYIIPIGGSASGGSMTAPLGALAYVEAFLEIHEQLKDRDIRVDALVLASGSGGTQAGLTVGAALLGDCRVIGITVSEPRAGYVPLIRDIAVDTLRALGHEVSMPEDRIVVLDEYIQSGYGVVTPEVVEAIRLTAVQEGIFLDPVYTGKAMAGLLDLIQKGTWTRDQAVLFYHTGGTAALFPERHSILRLLKK